MTFTKKQSEWNKLNRENKKHRHVDSTKTNARLSHEIVRIVHYSILFVFLFIRCLFISLELVKI